jgi:hypothetical protein
MEISREGGGALAKKENMCLGPTEILTLRISSVTFRIIFRESLGLVCQILDQGEPISYLIYQVRLVG